MMGDGLLLQFVSMIESTLYPWLRVSLSRRTSSMHLGCRLPRRDYTARRPISTELSPLTGLCSILQTVSLSHREDTMLRGKRPPRCDCRQRAVLPQGLQRSFLAL